ncbi:MAG: cytochrome b/b6 domain-containing protein [Rhodocyclaceae bacterium]|nr:cytochrome b/b6 domain-containing protein [Rhodocyclaceae bacterium]
MENIRVWDLPLRLFHWLLAAAVATAFISGHLGGNVMEWHGRIGLFILGLIVFRLIWGFVGSTHARFASFFPSAARIHAYLDGRWQEPGHNPLGALSVFALLGLLAIQAATGLCANDDIAFQGPLYPLVGSTWSGRLTGLHELVGNGLMALVALHVAAIAFYARVKKINLVRPMLTGTVPASELAGARQAQGGGLFSFLIAAALAGAVVWFIGGGHLALWLAPPPPPIATTPAW